MTSPIFFLGSHRTGSRALSQFFDSQVPGATSRHQHNGHIVLNILSNLHLAGWLPRGVLDRFADRVLLRRICRAKSRYFVETIGFNFLAVERVRERFPRSPVIHIVRDPRDFATSLVNWRHTRVKGKLVRSVIPYWDITAPMVREMTRRRWHQLKELEKYAWQWKYKNALIRDLYGGDPGNYRLIRFEDLFTGTAKVECLKELLSFLNVPWDDAYPDFFKEPRNASKKLVCPAWRSWSPETCRNVDRICGPLMRTWGYGNEREWQLHVGSGHETTARVA